VSERRLAFERDVPLKHLGVAEADGTEESNPFLLGHGAGEPVAAFAREEIEDDLLLATECGNLVIKLGEAFVQGRGDAVARKLIVVVIFFMMCFGCKQWLFTGRP